MLSIKQRFIQTVSNTNISQNIAHTIILLYDRHRRTHVKINAD